MQVWLLCVPSFDFAIENAFLAPFEVWASLAKMPQFFVCLFLGELAFIEWLPSVASVDQKVVILDYHNR